MRRTGPAPSAPTVAEQRRRVGVRDNTRGFSRDRPSRAERPPSASKPRRRARALPFGVPQAQGRDSSRTTAPAVPSSRGHARTPGRERDCGWPPVASELRLPHRSVSTHHRLLLRPSVRQSLHVVIAARMTKTAISSVTGAAQMSTHLCRPRRCQPRQCPRQEHLELQVTLPRPDAVEFDHDVPPHPARGRQSRRRQANQHLHA